MKKVAETIVKLILVLTVGRTIGYFLPHIYYQGGTCLRTLASLLRTGYLLLPGSSTDCQRMEKGS